MTPTQVDKDTFLKNLPHSGLLTEGQLRPVVDSLPQGTRTRAVARALVERGLLTKFQAELLLIGCTTGFFLGPYRILDQVGQGGMGRVYKALHQTMNRTVALKVLAPQMVKTEKAQALFRREIQAAAQLNHPNIVTAYDAGQINGRHFLAMEFVDGPNLEQLVRGRGCLPVGQACTIIRQAALGLQQAHDQGMVHRDIKPANLLIQKNGKGQQGCTVKILDFGLARLEDPKQQRGGRGTIANPDNMVMGTPDYLSPEQARSLHRVDIRSDLYSLGCTFYFLLSGTVPFPGGNTLEKLIRHTSDAPTDIAQLRSEVPGGVANIVRRLLAKSPAARFQTPEELAQALSPCAEPLLVNWDSSTRHTPLSMSTPTSKDNADFLAPSECRPEMVATVAENMSLTPLSAEAEALAQETSGTYNRARQGWLWALAIVGGLAATAGVSLAVWLNW